MSKITSMTKLTVLAAAIAVSGGCISAKTNPDDQAATAAPAGAGDGGAANTNNMDGNNGAVTSHTVVRGEHLWGISSMDTIYGTPFNWPLIYKANSDQIRDADLIYPGQELAIPRNVGQDMIDSAVQHAKTRGAWSLGPTEAVDTAWLGG